MKRTDSNPFGFKYPQIVTGFRRNNNRKSTRGRRTQWVNITPTRKKAVKHL